MPYKITADDARYIEEFRRNPIGRHSPGLQRVLNTMRLDRSGRQLVLVTLKPFAEWALAWLPADRREAVTFESNVIYTSREEAEWAVFRRRWEQHTGMRIEE
jgi:hypothetical protein